MDRPYYTSDGLNRYTAAGSVAPTYDTRGNLTSAGTQTYQFTATNRLFKAPGIGAYLGDALDRLDYVQAEGASLLAHDGAEITFEAPYSASLATIARRYVYGAGDDEPLVWYEGSGTSDKRWLAADERGSVIAATDATGNALTVNSYDAYGNEAASSATYRGRFGYTGQAWLPSVGLWHYKARMYAPGLGRFLQTDPIGYAGGLNWYNYVGSDPVNATDPSGLLDTKPCQTNPKVCPPVNPNDQPPPDETVIVDGGSRFARPPLQLTDLYPSGLWGVPNYGERSGGSGGGDSTPQKQCQRMDARSARGREFGGALSEWAGNASNALAIAAAVPTPATPVLAGLALLGKGLSLAGTGIQLAADYGHARRTGDYARLKADAAGALIGAVSPGALASRAARSGASAAADNFGRKATDGLVGATIGSFLPKGC